MMKSKIIAFFVVISLAVAGCSGSSSKTPEDKIATINTMMSKGYEMSEDQRDQITRSVEEARQMISQGKKDEANTILKKTIKQLKIIEETHLFNKSE